MSEAEYPQNEMIQDENPPVRRRGKKLILLLFVLLVLGGAGGGGYYYFLRPAAEPEADETAEETTEKEKKPKKKKKSSKEDPEAEETSSKKSKSTESEVPSDENVKNIVELQAFIVNLADADQARYLRMTVSVGIGGEGKEEKPDQLFVTKVRNAMIIVLSAKTSEEILSTEGKAKLRKELLKAAQSASEEPHVEAIYITDFIIQM